MLSPISHPPRLVAAFHGSHCWLPWWEEIDLEVQIVELIPSLICSYLFTYCLIFVITILYTYGEFDISVLGFLKVTSFKTNFYYRVCMLTGNTESEKREIFPWGDCHIAIPSPPFSSWDFGHTQTYTQCEFQAARSRTQTTVGMWESSATTTMPPTGSRFLS